jgi:hypothetical protein
LERKSGIALINAIPQSHILKQPYENLVKVRVSAFTAIYGFYIIIKAQKYQNTKLETVSIKIFLHMLLKEK